MRKNDPRWWLNDNMRQWRYAMACSGGYVPYWRFFMPGGAA